MVRTLLVLLPALVLPAQASSIPDAVEVRPGLYVLKGAPSSSTCEAMKRARITHVIDLRRDDEPNLECAAESAKLADLGIQYQRYALSKAPPPADLDFVRTLIAELPKGSQVVVHCGNGNRAAAAVCGYLVVERGMDLEKALVLAREAGLTLPETERALRLYLASKGKA